MPRLHLTVLPDGKCLITSEERLDKAEQEAIAERVEQWVRGDTPVLLIPDCDVVRMEVRP